MTNRLEVLVNGMDPVSKWGCGATFMLGTFGIIWVLCFYIYNIFWVTTVGKDEYKEVLVEIPGLTQRLTNLEANSAAKTEINGLVDQHAAGFIKREELATTVAHLNLLQTELQNLRASIATVGSNLELGIAKVDYNYQCALNEGRTSYQHLNARQTELQEGVARINSHNIPEMEQRLRRLEEETAVLKTALAELSRRSGER